MKVEPNYASINAVRDILQPWIEFWGGDEWGESMHALHRAGHTNYGLSDEDCAAVTEMLARNVIEMKTLLEQDGMPLYGYGYDDEDGPLALIEIRKRASELRDYWLEGGNLRGNTGAVATIESMPDWMFEA